MYRKPTEECYDYIKKKLGVYLHRDQNLYSESIFPIHKAVKYKHPPLTTTHKENKNNGKKARKTPKINDESLQKRNSTPPTRNPIPPNRRPRHSLPEQNDRFPENPIKNKPSAKINPKKP